MVPIRSPLGAIGVTLVALETVFGGTLFALNDAPTVQMAMAATMIVVFVAIVSVVLWMVVYLTLKSPGFLFNPAEVARLSESVQQVIYSPPGGRLSLKEEPADSPIEEIETDPEERDA